MYLSQMGNIPLLSREREIFLAKQIEITRKRFRRTVLESDFALRIAVETFEKVRNNELPFERTLCARPRLRRSARSKSRAA